MASLTQHYQLQELSAQDPFATNGQKYTTSDRIMIDRLLYVGAEGHHHTGLAVSQADPSAGGVLQVSNSGGNLPASTRASYQYTWVDPNGFESAPSPTAYVDLPAQISPPNPPALAATVGTGTLPSGQYFYALSAYTSTDTSETAVSTPTYANLSAVGEIVLTMPSLPSGATGFNIYRLDPNGANYLYLASTTGTTYTDNGSVAVNCNRVSPTKNTTNAANQVTFTLPESVPAGFTWNLYRTLVTGVWTNTLLGNQGTATSFVDTGQATTTGTPPLSSQLISTPSKIELTNGAEVQGILPTSMVDLSGDIFPYEVTFTFSGMVTPLTGETVWVCPFPSAQIISVQAALGRGSTPAAQPVICDVLSGTGVNPTYTSIFSGATPNPKPQVDVGVQIGTPAVPNVVDLGQGDSLSVDVDQAGGGATPTDQDLVVTIYLRVAKS